MFGIIAKQQGSQGSREQGGDKGVTEVAGSSSVQVSVRDSHWALGALRGRERHCRVLSRAMNDLTILSSALTR